MLAFGIRSILRSIDWKLQHIHDIVQSMELKMTQMSDEIQTLKDDVAAERTAVDSATALISGFAAQLQAAVQAAQDAGATPQQLQDLTDLHTALTQQTTDLASAVANQSPPATGGTSGGSTGGTDTGGTAPSNPAGRRG
jgi:Mg2+ and Co2+ transporter CorA